MVNSKAITSHPLTEAHTIIHTVREEKSLERGDQLQPGMTVFMGLPFDEFSSFTRGPALAPPRIREALNSGSTCLCSEDGNDLGADPLRITAMAAARFLKEIVARRLEGDS